MVKTKYWNIVMMLILGALARISHGQAPLDQSLTDTILHLDSLLFSVGFNTHDIAPFETLMAEDCEFYHDQSGFTQGRASFTDGLENGLFKLDYLATRELVKDSTKIFPLYNGGELYGVIQNGVHEFFATYSDGKKAKTSVAKFTHLWLKEGEHWLLSRVLSFDHKQP